MPNLLHQFSGLHTPHGNVKKKEKVKKKGVFQSINMSFKFFQEKNLYSLNNLI